MEVSQINNTLLNEKYRPDTLDNFVGNENLKDSLSRQIQQNDIQNYIFYGTAGGGKTTLSKIIVNSLDCDYLYINASDERGIDTIRNKVIGFASTVSFKPLKVIILDEADYLTINAQTSLRNIIETYSASTRFIMTCNYINKIIDPLQSRCHTIKIIPPSKSLIAKHLYNILEKEGIKFEMGDLKSLVNFYYPDLRKCLNTIQSCTIDGELKLDGGILLSSSYINKIIGELKNNKPSIKNIRQIVLDSNVEDFEQIFEALYDRADEYLPGKQGTVALLVNDHQYKSNFRVDQEINFIALIQNIINNK